MEQGERFVQGCVVNTVPCHTPCLVLLFLALCINSFNVCLPLEIRLSDGISYVASVKNKHANTNLLPRWIISD